MADVNVDVGSESQSSNAGDLLDSLRAAFPSESCFQNPACAWYVSELAAHGLDRLRGEPARLAAESAKTAMHTRDIAGQHYRTFIRAAECSAGVLQDFVLVERRLEAVLDALPALAGRCDDLASQGEQLCRGRRVNSLALARHTHLLEVLEIPQLMHTCVRNGYYDEALELIGYVKRLERKHSSVPVIQGIVADVRASSQLLLSQLLHQLRGPVTLPACLRVVSYLRRLDALRDTELRLKFLQVRDAWLEAMLSAIPRDDPHQHLVKSIEACRVHLFDIVTQYRAVFADDEAVDGAQATAVFHSWMSRRVLCFLSVLEAGLWENGSRNSGGARPDSLLEQCMYFGLSLGRIGGDFRALLAPMFQRLAYEAFDKATAWALESFIDDMHGFTLLSIPTGLGHMGDVQPDVGETKATPPMTLQPPLKLIDFPPLACFVNGLLTAFNDLRLCCPIALAHDVSVCVQQLLEKVTFTIVDFHRSEAPTFSRAEEDLFTRFCSTYVQQLLPFLNRCLQALFPPSQLAQALGVPLTRLPHYTCLGCLDIPVLLSPISEFLPPKGTEVPTSPDLETPPSISPHTSEQESDREDSNPISLREADESNHVLAGNSEHPRLALESESLADVNVVEDEVIDDAR
uniref:Conserved oligomeric Golgi complex subunit 8 n=2 Tax=Eptatretus burgeri TaxID=7764 RepID=A0A8C4NFI6_EPTBU